MTLVPSLSIKTAAKIIKTIQKSNFSQLQKGAAFDASLMTIGFRGYSAVERKNIKGSIYKKYWRLYKQELYKRNFDSARVLLNKWNETLPKKLTAKYSFELAKLHLFKGELKSALTIASFRKKNMSDIYKLNILKEYINYYLGNHSSATRYVINVNYYKNYADYFIFQALDALVKGNYFQSITAYKNTKNKKYLFSKSRLHLLFAEYLHAFNYPIKAKQVLSTVKMTTELSDREILKYMYLRGENKLFFPNISRKIKTIIKARKVPLQSGTSAMKGLKNLITYRSHNDRLSAFPLLFIIQKSFKEKKYKIAHKVITQAPINSIIAKSFWLDMLSLRNRLNNIYTIFEKYKNDISNISILLPILKKYKFNFQFKLLSYEKALKEIKIKKHMKAYNTLNGIKQSITKKDTMYNKFMLLRTELYTRSNQLNQAKASLSKLKNRRLSFNEKLHHSLLKAKLKLYEVKKILTQLSKGNKLKRRTQMLEIQKLGRLFEKSFKKTITIIKKSPKKMHAIIHGDLLHAVMDDYINYKIQTKRIREAILYAELKKFISMQQKIKLKKPTLFNSLPLNNIMNNIPKNTALLYLITYGNHIYCWIIKTKTIKGKSVYKKGNIKLIKVVNGLKKIKSILKSYNKSKQNMTGTRGISIRLSKVFKKITSKVKKSTSLIIIPDDTLEKIPFEIIGKKKILAETHDIYYMPSLYAMLQKKQPQINRVTILKNGTDTILNNLTDIAIGESGITHSLRVKNKTGMAHISKPIIYSKNIKEISLGLDSYSNTLSGFDFIYLNSDYPEILTNANVSLLNYILNIKGTIVNTNTNQDISNAIFIEEFYKKISKGKNIIEAFTLARNKLIKHNTYKHPAYWTGIRLYMNCITK